MAWEEQAKSFTDMFKRLGESMHVPQVDIDAVLDSQRKNIEALEQSARAGATGAASLMAKQKDAVEEGMREAASMLQAMNPAGSPGELMSRQAEFAKRSLEAAVKNASEMTEIIRKSGAESTDILRQRIRDSMEETLSRFTERK